MNKLRSILRKHRRMLGALALALAVVGIFWAVNSPAIVGASAASRKLPIYCVQRDNKAVSITFDAAWGNEDTQALIDILNRYGVRATFFLVGEWVDKYPESVRALSESGMEIGNHSDTHPHMASLSAADIQSEAAACSAKIESVTGTAPALFRCPYGEYNDEVISSVENTGMTCIQWDVETLQTKETPGNACHRERPGV